MGLTVGASAAVTVTVADATEGPPQLVAVKLTVMEVSAATCGAVKFGLATVALSKVPEGAVQA